MFSKMPWSSASNEEPSKPAKEEEEGESLTTVLTTPEDRSALTILVADCTEAMRQSILDIFDAKQTGLQPKSDTVVDLKDEAALARINNDPPKDDAAERDKQRKELQQREKELSAAKFKQLKEAALKHFDEWRSNVMQRVGEIVNSRETAEMQKEQASPKKAPSSPKEASPPMKFTKPTDYDTGVDEALLEQYLPVKSSLKILPEEKKALILHSLLLLLLSLEHYHAESRVLLLRISTSLGLSIKYLGYDESKVARGLLNAAESMNADEETKKKAEENQSMRKWKVGAATIAGAALIGITGGLAAPLLAAGVGSVMGGLGLGATAAAGYLGTLASSTILVGGLFGAYGGRMTGKMMDQYAREVEDFGFVPIKSQHRPRKIEKEFRRLRVGIGISGWLTNEDGVTEPWKVIGIELESFALRWELQALLELGNSLDTIVKSAAWNFAKREVIRHTVFAALAAGLWPLALVKVSRIIENPWSVASYRAQKAGEVLADALINKAQGERPVTLTGYSLGAKVIYTCLQRLAERRAFGLVENVVLMGAPTPSTPAEWRMIRSVVAGRVVNAYSTQDYILAYLYRSSSIQYGVAGLQAIENVKGVENVDVSEMVSGHTAYRFSTGPILQQLGFENIDMAELEKEKQQLKEEEAKEEKARQENEMTEQVSKTSLKGESAADSTAEARNAVVGADTGTGTGAKVPEVSDKYVEDLQKEVEKKNEESYIGWAQGKMVRAGTNAAVAYEKAKAQWFLRSQGEAGKAAAGVAKGADQATGDVNKTAKAAGVDAPTAGDVAYQGMKANSTARKTAPQAYEGT